MLRPELELGPEFLPFKLSDSVEHIYAHTTQRERERKKERQREREREKEREKERLSLILYHDAVECKVVKYNEN